MHLHTPSCPTHLQTPTFGPIMLFGPIPGPSCEKVFLSVGFVQQKSNNETPSKEKAQVQFCRVHMTIDRPPDASHFAMSEILVSKGVKKLTIQKCKF